MSLVDHAMGLGDIHAERKRVRDELERLCIKPCKCENSSVMLIRRNDVEMLTVERFHVSCRHCGLRGLPANSAYLAVAQWNKDRDAS